MGEKNALLVGLADEQVASLGLSEGVVATRIDDAAEALNLLSLSPPDLIIANATIGAADSLDFFGQIMRADPESTIPVVFLAAPQSGIDPFLYQRERPGFTVRFVDAAGSAQEHFVPEPCTEHAFTLRSLSPEQVATEVARLLGGEPAPAPASEVSSERLFELGFNQVVTASGQRYHVQTEVVAVDPVVVSCTVICAGRTVHAAQEQLNKKAKGLDVVRAQVEAIQADAVARVKTGGIA
jgi:hypothetical protein